MFQTIIAVNLHKVSSRFHSMFSLSEMRKCLYLLKISMLLSITLVNKITYQMENSTNIFMISVWMYKSILIFLT